MPITPFASGSFAFFPLCAEWDGANESDLLQWVRDNDTFDDAIPEANRWQISSVSAEKLVLYRPSAHPAGYSMTVTVPINQWVALSKLSNGHLYPQTVDPSGRWKTSDPHGRPLDLNDLLA